MSNQIKQAAQTDKAPKAESQQIASDYASEQIISPGKELVKARDAMGLSQQDVADRLHLRLSSVQAVETDALEAGVSVTFTKGYVRLYAHLVHLKPEPLLLAYNNLHHKENQPAKLQSFSRRVSREAHDHRWNMVSIVVVLLVLGSVVVWWVDREGYFRDSGKNITEAFDEILSGDDAKQNMQTDLSTVSQDSVLKQDAGPQILEEDLVDGNSQLDGSSLNTDIDDSHDGAKMSFANAVNETEKLLDDTVNQAEQAVDSVTPNDTTTASVTQTNSGGREVDPSRGDIVEGVFTDAGYRVNSDGTVDVTFTFLKDCWVSVKDGKGETMAIGVKTKGRVMHVSGLPPVSVILGAPKSVEIDFGGYQVNMDVYPGGETAKFSLPIES